MDIRQQIGINVQRLRREKGWSQEELAFESKLHRTYISGIETGKRNPTALIIARLAKTLDATPMAIVADNRKARSAGKAKRKP